MIFLKVRGRLVCSFIISLFLYCNQLSPPAMCAGNCDVTIESQLHSSVPFTGMGQRGLRNIITPAFIFQKKRKDEPEPSNLSQLEAQSLKRYSGHLVLTFH